jgi:hypothetical protein
MGLNLKNRLKEIFEDFAKGNLTTSDFHLAIETTINLITEADFDDLRLRLREFESELELIDFTVNEDQKMEYYSKKVSDILVSIEEFLQ